MKIPPKISSQFVVFFVVSIVRVSWHNQLFFIRQPPYYNRRQALACRSHSRSIKESRFRKYAGSAVVAELLVGDYHPFRLDFCFRSTEISCHFFVYSVVVAVVRVYWHNRHIFIGQPTYNRRQAEIDLKALVLVQVLMPLWKLE